MTKLNELFVAFVETNHGSVVTRADIVTAYEYFLGLTGDFTSKDQRIAYWKAKNISVENFAELFLKEAAQLNAKNAAEFGETIEGRKAVVSAARDAAVNGDIEAIRQKVKDVVESQPGEGEQPGVPGETFSLTSGAEVVRPATAEDERDEEGNLVAVEGVQFATENNDIINGVYDSLSSRRTLDQNDKIDGGAGNDTLNATLNANFGGFNAGFGVSNVEIINLTNESNHGRTFNAREITGAEEFNLINKGTGSIRLNDLEEADIAVGVSGLAQAKGTGNVDLNINFKAAAVTGQDDSLQLNLSGVGREAQDCDNTENGRMVNLKTNGIEHLNLNAVAGYNDINLDKNGTKTITATGAGELVFGSLASTVTKVDASKATGDVTGNLSGIEAQSLSELKGGAGDDSFTVNLAALKANTTINGGEGDDELTINVQALATARSLQLNMSDIQTLKVTDAGGTAAKLTLSGELTTDLEVLNYARSLPGSEVVLADMQTEDFTINLANASVGDVVYDGEGDLTVNTVGGSVNEVNCITNDLTKNGNAGDTAAKNASEAKVTAANASNITLNVANNSKYTGELVAAVAEVVTLNVGTALGNEKDVAASGSVTLRNVELTEFAGILTATTATQINVNAQGRLGASDFDLSGSGGVATITAATFNVNAAESLNLNVTAGALNVYGQRLAQIDVTQSGDEKFVLADAGTTLNAVEVLNIQASHEFVVSGALEVLSQGVYRGTGEVGFSAAGVSAKSQQVDLNAQQLLGDFAVALNTFDMTTNNNAPGTAQIVGSNIGENIITVGTGRTEINIVGGVSDDTISVAATNSHKTTAEITTGLGTDTILLVAGTSGAADTQLFVTITDFTAGVDVLELNASGSTWSSAAEIDNTDATDAIDAIDALNAFEAISGVTKENSKFVTFVVDGTAGTTVENGILYNDTVYTFNALAGSNDSILVALTGISVETSDDWLVA